MARVPLGFDPTAPPPPGPPVTVTPTTGLTDQQIGDRRRVRASRPATIGDLPCCTAATTTDLHARRLRHRAPVTFTGRRQRRVQPDRSRCTSSSRMADGRPVDCSVSTPDVHAVRSSTTRELVARDAGADHVRHPRTDPPVVAFRFAFDHRADRNRPRAPRSTSCSPSRRTTVVRVDWKHRLHRRHRRRSADYVGVYNGTIGHLRPARRAPRCSSTSSATASTSPTSGSPIAHLQPAGATVGPDARRHDPRRRPAADGERRQTPSVKDRTPCGSPRCRCSSVPSGFPVTVRFTTHQFTARAEQRLRRDHAARSRSRPARPSATIAVVILGDRVHESTETLLVTIDSRATRRSPTATPCSRSPTTTESHERTRHERAPATDHRDHRRPRGPGRHPRTDRRPPHERGGRDRRRSSR